MIHIYEHLINRVLQTGYTPLHCAGWGGGIAVARVLLDRGANLNALTNVWTITSRLCVCLLINNRSEFQQG